MLRQRCAVAERTLADGIERQAVSFRALLQKKAEAAEEVRSIHLSALLAFVFGVHFCVCLCVSLSVCLSVCRRAVRPRRALPSW
jgi:hypothetical protein